VLGFKEIRYQTPEILQFLGAVFPCARFVFTYRENPQVRVRAKAFKNTAQKPDIHHEWAQGAELFKTVHANFPNTTALLPVEQMSTDSYNQVLHELLGVRGCSFREVVHENSKGGYSKPNQGSAGKASLEGDCDLSLVNFDIDEPSVLKQQEQAWRNIRVEYNPAREGSKPFVYLPHAPKAPQFPPKFAQYFFSSTNPSRATKQRRHTTKAVK
jgi:hypothetical protein